MSAEWQPSIQYAEAIVDAPIERAWELMIDYESYNPTFGGSTVTRVEGARNTEGEVVVIQKVDHDTGEPDAPFYCKTAKFQPPRAGAPAHIVWYLWNDADEIRNFVDFGLREEPRGVVFWVQYYAQNRLTGDALATFRADLAAFQPVLIDAFQRHCKEDAA